MHLLRCFVSVLLVFVLLFALCSTSCFALAVPNEWQIDNYPEIIPNEIPIKKTATNFAVTQNTEYKLHYQSYARFSNNLHYVDGSSFANYSTNLPIPEGTPFNTYSVRDYSWSDYNLCESLTFYRSDGAIIGTEGMSLNLHIKDFQLMARNGKSDGSYTPTLYFDIKGVNSCILKLTDSKGQVHYQNLNPSDYIFESSNKGYLNFIIDIESLPCDVKKVEFEIAYYSWIGFPGLDPNNYPSIYKYSGIGNPSANATIKTTVDMFCRTDTGGLLGNIIKIATNIKDGITDLGGKVTTGFGNVVNSITQLPSKIWSFFEDGLKGLFIPTEEQMIEVKTDWDNLLSDRFGGLYQSIQLIDDYASSFTNTESKNTIKVPELSVDLVGSTFTFGGQDVQIIPDKFSFLIDVIKTIISIIATTFFVNGLRNRFTREVIEGGTEQ